MTFGTAGDLSLQVVAIPMTSFGMLMNSPQSEFQRISPETPQCPLVWASAPGPGKRDPGATVSSIDRLIWAVFACNRAPKSHPRAAEVLFYWGQESKE